MYRLFMFTHIFMLIGVLKTDAQPMKIQQGLLLKNGSNIRLGDVRIYNKRTRAKSRSNTLGVFNIGALPGDTIVFTADNYKDGNLTVTDFADKIIYLEPVILLNEVVIKENSLRADIKEVQRVYRSKSVFYTGVPHYYYLVLKPMTFIYENFKSEVIEARRFNRFAKKETIFYKISERFNDSTIRAAVPIKKSELVDFEMTYSPSIEKLNAMSDYDLMNFIRSYYADFKKEKSGSSNSLQTKNPG